MRFWSIDVASVSATIAAGSFWGIAVTGIWRPLLPPRAMIVNLGAGVVAAIVAVMCWLVRWRARQEENRAHQERDWELLITTLADAVPVQVPARPLARTVPFPRAL